ncbi:MAG: hypothetical protein ACOC16_00020 [Nanoarchaeota archaeon]
MEKTNNENNKLILEFLNRLKVLLTSIKISVDNIAQIDLSMTANTLTSIFSDELNKRKNIQYIQQNNQVYKDKCDKLITNIGNVINDIDKNEESNMQQIKQQISIICQEFNNLKIEIINYEKYSQQLGQVYTQKTDRIEIEHIVSDLNQLHLDGQMLDSVFKSYRDETINEIKSKNPHLLIVKFNQQVCIALLNYFRNIKDSNIQNHIIKNFNNLIKPQLDKIVNLAIQNDQNKIIKEGDKFIVKRAKKCIEDVFNSRDFKNAVNNV